MKVLMTADTLGGVWVYALELCRELLRRDVEVVLATLGGPLSEGQRGEARGIAGLEVREGGFRLEWMPEPWEDVRRAGHWLMRLEEEVRPDLVHLNHLAHGHWPWRAPVLVVGHSCVLSWWRAVLGGEAPAKGWRRYREEVSNSLAAADAVAAPSAVMLRALEGHYGAFRRTKVIYNGRDARAFPPGEKEPFILAAGRLWDKAKNVAALEAAARSLDWEVLVAGDESGPGGQAYTGSLRRLGSLSQAEMGGRLAKASIYALPAFYEPFGLSALEAAHAGCALVLGGIPSLREVWGDAAVYAPPGDPEALAWRLDELIRDPRRRSAMGARARHRAQRYTPSAMAEAYLREYRALPATRGKGAGKRTRVWPSAHRQGVHGNGREKGTASCV